MQATTLRLIPQSRWRWRWSRKVERTTAAFPTAIHSRSCPQSKATDPAILGPQTPQTIRPVLNLRAEVCLHLILKAEKKNLLAALDRCWTKDKDRDLPSSQSPVHLLLSSLYHTTSTLLPTYIYTYYIHPELRIGNCRSGMGKGA